MKKYKMDKLISKYCRIYIKKHFSSEYHLIEQRANNIYQQFCLEAPDIGYGENLMASNLYQFLTFLAYYEASDRRITKEDIREVVNLMLKDFSAVSKFIDLNRPFVWKVFYGISKPYVRKLKKKKAKGLWANTWDMLINPLKHQKGFSIHLLGCPLYDFAKSHGYEDILPEMCQIDHDIAALMHGKLIRKETLASGGKVCDYWYLGDKMTEN